MPRRAAADIPPLTEVDRPDPPGDMPEGAAAIWRKTARGRLQRLADGAIRALC
jgi:hypothetical protein